MKVFKKKGILILLAALLFSSAVFYGFNRDEKNFEISKNLNIYHTLFRELNMFYVDEIDSGDLIKKSMDAMLSSLDPYTTYIPESEMEDFKLMTTGEYAGIGSLISKHGDDIIVAEPYKDLPADKAGLKAGDIFVEINGIKINKKGTSDVSNLLKGQANKPLSITVRRPGVKKLIEKEVVRAEIQLKSVPYYGMLKDSIGYINLNQFTNKASGEVSHALRELKEQQAKSIILDLRGNPGGLLDQSVKIVNLFVEKGENVVSTKGKVSQWDKVYKAEKMPMDTEIPIVVLVSRGSASASEIVSGAIQDLDRGVIVGQRTFGKGLVQTTRNLSYNSKLKVTTAKYYIPSGRCIQALDYSHRNEDGSVGKVPDTLTSEFKTKNGRKVRDGGGILPDTLTSEFKTKNGRKVRDGGGILPDVKVKMDLFSSLSVGLIRKFKIFDYATLYANKHAEIADANSFELSDKDYEDFKLFLNTEKFEYKSESTEILEALKKAAKEEKYFTIAKEEFDNISAKLTPNLDRDLKMFEKEIKSLLSHEIIKRYHYQIGGILYALKDDKVLKEAMAILKDEKKYDEILKK